MRVVATLLDEKLAYQFSTHLLHEGIENHVERAGNAFYVWVDNEDELGRALDLYAAFEKGPIDIYMPKPPRAPRVQKRMRFVRHRYNATVTKCTIVLCVLIFVLMHFPGSSSMVNYLLFEAPRVPSWGGLYNELLARHFSYAPMFSEILHGQIWRLFTPVLMHANILHILFNMLWLWVLGKPMEERLHSGRLILFIVITAIFSNIAQYLMSGPLFLGFSGVIAAMAGYIFVRQKDAPWEGYPIHSSTFAFLAIFILGFAALSVLSFFLAFFKIYDLNFNLANTAHISGAIIGALLAKLRVFK